MNSGAGQPDRYGRILVIKLGALGDVVLAMGPFAAIRRHHPRAHIVLLTGAAYADFLRPSGWFDEIWTDDRPRLYCVNRWLALRRRRARQAGLHNHRPRHPRRRAPG